MFATISERIATIAIETFNIMDYSSFLFINWFSLIFGVGPIFSIAINLENGEVTETSPSFLGSPRN